jgi:hypothetical protein
VHQLPFVISIDDWQLVFRVENKDLGIRELAGSAILDCSLTCATWKTVAGYMEAFLEPCDTYFNSFHWLDETFQWNAATSETSFLFSPHREGLW